MTITNNNMIMLLLLSQDMKEAVVSLNNLFYASPNHNRQNSLNSSGNLRRKCLCKYPFFYLSGATATYRLFFIRPFWKLLLTFEQFVFRRTCS